MSCRVLRVDWEVKWVVVLLYWGDTGRDWGELGGTGSYWESIGRDGG